MDTEISVRDLINKLDGGDPVFLLDVRNADEFANWRLEGKRSAATMNIPYFDFIEDPEAALARVPRSQTEISVVCAKGGSSEFVADLLRESGIPARNVAGGMQAIADALRTPLFLKEELERERQVVIGEYDRNESNPFFKLTSEIGKKLYPGQWSRKNVIGDRDVILTVTPQKMREIQRKYYVPNNSALIVTGDVNPDSVFALAEKTYGDWQKGPDPFAVEPIPAIPAIQKNDALIIEQPVGAVTVMLQWQGPSVRKDPTSTYAADVFSDVLNQPNSTLQRRLVDTGLWQSIGVNYYTLDHVGPTVVERVQVGRGDDEERDPLDAVVLEPVADQGAALERRGLDVVHGDGDRAPASHATSSRR